MTYRLMAEWATDAVCRKLGNTRPCTTADTPLRLTGTGRSHAAQSDLPARSLRGSAVTGTAIAHQPG
ncbi:hypothetical protein ECZU26_52330 [Escherichia coli]|nr:hypothetical protein ECZU26_52330 [Escherichia coli]